MIRNLLAAALAFAAMSAQAQACLDNFVGEGNFGADRSYKTFAVLPDVRPQDAFARISAFTLENGFTILASSPADGVISAAEAAAHAKGKTVPLNISVLPEGQGTRVSLHFITVAGVLSPIGAIKRHFCTTVAAAASPPVAAGAASSPGEVGHAPR